MDYKKTLSQARKRFEQLCNDAGKEYLLDEYNLDNWTLRDYVSECAAEAQSQSEYDNADKPLINKYKRFINSYKDQINGIPTNERHYSKYDMAKPVQREVERWVTIGGRRIPIFKKDAASPTIKGIKKLTGNPELRIYGRDKRDNHSIHIKDDFYPDKKSAYQDTRANGYKGVRVFDKRDDYILDHTNYTGMSSIWKDYSKYRQWEKHDRKEGANASVKLWKEKADELKQIIDKANKVYLQKQKRYKIKK